MCKRCASAGPAACPAPGHIRAAGGRCGGVGGMRRGRKQVSIRQTDGRLGLDGLKVGASRTEFGVSRPGGADMVDHPAHYTRGGVECIDAIRSALGERGFVDHCRACAIKYAWRSPHKGAEAEDLRKAAWYLSRAADELDGD